jgi:hypothetical protein
MRSVENELKECFNAFQEKLLMEGYDVEFKNKDQIIEKIAEPIFDTIKDSVFSTLMVEIIIKPEHDNPIVGKTVFGNSMDFIEDYYFRMNEYYNLYNDGNYIEVSFVMYDDEEYRDIYSSEDEDALPLSIIEEMIDGHIESIKNNLKSYDIEPEYDYVINAVTFRIPLDVEITKILV